MMRTLFALLALTPAAAFADTWTNPDPEPMPTVAAPAKGEVQRDVPDVQHDLSLTFSPLHLTAATFEATGEFRVLDKLGLAIVAGGGGYGGVGVYEIGSSVRWYPIGTFVHGMQLGAEVLYAGGGGGKSGTFVHADVLSAGGFVGYKIATNIGFTFEAQAGVSGVVAGATGIGTISGVLPLINANVGWSFDI